MSAPKVDIAGQRFGLLLAIESAGSNAAGKAKWLCRCDCGTDKVVRGDSLRLGISRSCGCGPRKNRTHGMHGTPIYRVWIGMVRRCTSPKANRWESYGGRGIQVCEPWRKFENFYADMGPTWRAGLSIDRIDPDGHYEPSNCRWATRAEQDRNLRRTVLITWRGHSMIAADWALVTGLRAKTISKRSQAGWSAERALTTRVDMERLDAALAQIGVPSAAARP